MPFVDIAEEEEEDELPDDDGDALDPLSEVHFDEDETLLEDTDDDLASWTPSPPPPPSGREQRDLRDRPCCVPGAPCDQHTEAVANVIAQLLPGLRGRPVTKPRGRPPGSKNKKARTALSVKRKYKRQAQKATNGNPPRPAESNGSPRAAAGTPVQRVMPLTLTEDTTRKYRCRTCRAIIQGDQELLQHWNTKHVTANTKEDVRDKPRAMVLDDEVAHVVLRAKSKQQYKVVGGWKCPLCLKVMAMHTRLRTHMFLHMEYPPLTYRCHLCPENSVYAYSEYSSLYCHLKSHHKSVKPYSCKTCGQGFDLPSKLKMHVKEHKDVLHQCEVCGQNFALEGTLSWHVRTAHKNIL